MEMFLHPHQYIFRISVMSFDLLKMFIGRYLP